MLALGETCLCAGRRHGGIDDLGVAVGLNSLLCYENLGTYRAVLALGESRCGAGRCHSGIDNLGVAGGTNSLLCYENLGTY